MTAGSNAATPSQWRHLAYFFFVDPPYWSIFFFVIVFPVRCDRGETEGNSVRPQLGTPALFSALHCIALHCTQQPRRWGGLSPSRACGAGGIRAAARVVVAAGRVVVAPRLALRHTGMTSAGEQGG